MQPSTFAGIVSLLLVAGPLSATDYTWLGSLSSDWSEPANWSPSGVPGPEDQVNCPAGSPPLSVGGERTVGGFIQAGGILAGPGQLTVRTNGTWSGGTIREGCILSIPAGATWSITGSASRGLVGGTVRVAGQARWEGTANIGSGEGALWEVLPGGVLEIRNDGGIYHSYAGAVPTVRNAGTVRKLESTGTSEIGVPFHNEGALEVLGGRLRLTRGGASTGRFTATAPGVIEFAGGTHDLSASASWEGSGSFRVSSGTVNHAGTCEPAGVVQVSTGTLNLSGSAATIATLELTGGTLTGTGQVSIAHTLTWSGGTLSGSGEVIVPTGARLVLSGTGGKSLRRRPRH